MMEGMDQLGQEEYIWAMRTSAYGDHDEGDAWKERRSIALVDKTVKSQIGTTGSGGSLKTEHQTKVMASLIPDEVIYNVNDYSQRPYDACFLFGDVSGFTELCEKYNKTGISGPSRMTQVLNKYLGAMVQEVMSHNGDVLKFSGDAFLAIWKATENDNMRDAVHEAIDCALVIQKNYGSYATDVGVIIRVKLAISAGNVIFGLIGDERNSHYVVVGKPIWDVKAAEHKSVAGDIVVAPAGWYYVNPNEYLYQEMNDRMHNKILGIGPNWRSVQRNVGKKATGTDYGDDAASDYGDDDDSSSTGSDLVAKPDTADDFSLRPSVNAACRLNIAKDMRKFIIAPVMKSIDMNEPFEYLSEMRQTVVVFINIICARCEVKESVRIADQTYKIVCGAVNDHKGCVNKVSFFDKDLMLVVVFGLRGLKHELESQTALRCGTECQQAIMKIKKVLSVSIGITTGKTYCGVFGHTLRREYTVISLIVNKAARLMCAYKDKVTCDRETFLHSKLEAKNFILQEHKELKGISNPGPVYEFREITLNNEDAAGRANFFPILGRDEELKIYKRLLNNYLEINNKRPVEKLLLVIQGCARQGKSRLLEEFIFITPPHVPVNRICLNIKDSKIPYQAVRLFFALPLGLTLDSPTKVKEAKLRQALKHIKMPELLCVLNVAFGVDFRRSDVYISMSKKQREIALLKMITQLCYGAFVTKWVLAVDNTEYIDDESLPFLMSVLDIKHVFIVCTWGKQKPFRALGTKLLQDPRTEVITISNIDRWYHGGLACQMLDVYALPPELEKVIQAKSNGNPGWIESFLVSLMQAEGILIFNTDLKHINEMGLVAPPLYMMARMTPEEQLEWKKVMEERRPSMESINDDFWKVYVDVCRDDHLNVTIRGRLEKRLKATHLVPVCVVCKKENIADVDAELSMDVIILKTFDSLTSYEQLLVKCSAILGNQFLRDMLIYVMAASNPREAAIAVKRLFENKVLCCAKGDFVEEGNMVFRERLMDPNEKSSLECYCRGNKIDESCSDLPMYASCGYMQFRASLFRDITYNLLTDNQKKEFHYRAIRYLEKETRRCRACGHGFFNQFIGVSRENDLSGKKKNRGGQSRSFAWDETGTASHRTSIHSTSRKASIHSSATLKNKPSRQDTSSFSDSVTGGTQMDDIPSSRRRKKYHFVFGFTMINKLKDSFSLTRAFSSSDFTDCQCNLILSFTYSQLIEHCRGAGNISKTIEVMLEYVQVSMDACNLPLAMKTIEDAMKLLDNPDNKKENETEETIWKAALIRGKILCLKGHAQIELGLYDEAMASLNMSLRQYGLEFPTGSTTKSWIIKRHRLKQNFGMYFFPGTLRKNLNRWEAIYCNNLSQCLSHIFTLHMITRLWKDAELAATWSLTKGLEAYNNFEVICTAYTNLLEISHQLGNMKLAIALEVHALRICHMKDENMEPLELRAVAALYGVIFCNRVGRSNLDKAIHIGYIVLRICSSIHCVKVVLPILPLLLRVLLMGKHTNNALSVLESMDEIAEEDTDSSGRIWYYALCMCFNLETGYTAVRYEKCERYFMVECENTMAIRDPNCTKRFFTVMWLWCIRNEKWESAALWTTKVDDFTIIEDTDKVANKMTALYLLEGLILYLVCKMDRRNLNATVRAEREIEQLMALIQKCSRQATVILPRLFHLKAYYRLVKLNDSSAFHILNKAKKLAVKYNNLMEVSYIEHSEKAWSRTLSPIAADFWREHNDPDNLLDYRALEGNFGKIGFFTLPLPLFM